MNIRTFRKKLYFLFLFMFLLTGAFETVHSSSDMKKQRRPGLGIPAAGKDFLNRRSLNITGNAPNLRAEKAIGRLARDEIYNSLMNAVRSARQNDGQTFGLTALDAVNQTAKLVNDGGEADYFGYSAAISGDTAVVGVPYDSRAAREQGSAYVFVRSGAGWTQQARLTANDGAAFDSFGWAVAISGDTIAVGAPGNTVAFNTQGAAYVFTRGGTVWTQQQQLTANDASAQDLFGASIAISGDTIVVGASGDDVNAAGDDRGSAYVFVRSGATWTQQARLFSTAVSVDASFGASVAVSGDTVVVGAYNDTVGTNFSQGSAYVFARNGASWTQQARITGSGGVAEDNFGNSVAIDGGTVVVGAFAADIGSNIDQGSAYVFVRSGADWTQQAQLSGANGAADDTFGDGVAISGDSIIVGASGDDVGSNADQGSAYVFTRGGTVWTRQQQLTASDGTGDDLFGYGVGISGSNFIVGAYADDIGANRDQGSAYIFAPLSTAPAITSLSPNTRGAGGIAFELTVSGSGFVGDSVVRFNGQNRATTFVSATQLKVQILSSDVQTAGQFPVTVFNPSANGGTSNAVNFTVIACAYSINPASQNFTSAGGNGGFTVTGTDGCGYSATSSTSSITLTGGANGVGSGTISFSVAANTGAARAGTITVGGQTFTVNQAAGTVAAPRKPLFDFDGDGKADLSLYRPSNTIWYILNSSNSSVSYTQFGLSTDKIVPADYDGDGKTDIAVFRPENGYWYILNSTGTVQYVQFGLAEDLPMPADYNGDGRAELAVFRPSNGIWFILDPKVGSYTVTQFGMSGDKPVAADYNGDGKSEIAVYRPSNGFWFIYNFDTKQYTGTKFGISTDKPVPADYNGDGKTDIAVYRPNEGNWYISTPTGNGYTVTQFGLSTDLPAPADYDGDGKTDIAVYRSSEGNWYQLNSTKGFGIYKFGLSEDKPTPNAFVY